MFSAQIIPNAGGQGVVWMFNMVHLCPSVPQYSTAPSSCCLAFPWQLGCNTAVTWAVLVTDWSAAQVMWELHDGKEKSLLFAKIKQFADCRRGLKGRGLSSCWKSITRALVTFSWTFVSAKRASVGTRGIFPSSFGSIEMYVKTLVLENLCRKGFDELFWDVCPH